jgi:hypothetical protein
LIGIVSIGDVVRELLCHPTGAMQRMITPQGDTLEQ